MSTLPFAGVTFDAKQDGVRLSTAMERVYELLQDGGWWTLGAISRKCQCSEAGASARLRDLRKEKFQLRYPNGGIESRRIDGGLWVYRMLPNGRGDMQRVLFY